MGFLRQGSEPRLRRCASAAALAAIAAVLVVAAPASAQGVEDIYVREVYAGGVHNDSYVVLQASVAGENQVTGHTLTAYGVSGNSIGTATFQADMAHSESQMTMLIADTAYSTSFQGGPAPNLSMPSLNLSPGAGAVCWEGFDCVAWGNFTGTLPSPTGQNALAMTSSERYVLNRNINRGCPSALDADDDTDNSYEDFSKRLPNPRNNNSLIAETVCEGPSSAIDTAPPRETDSTSAEFTFHSYPSGAELECRLRGEVFTPCQSGSKSYTGLAEGYHQFQVRARNAPDPAGEPASYRWKVDLTPPTTTIEFPPENPNPGPDITFYFSADEEATFECSMVPAGEADAYEDCVTQKTYQHLANGSYTFRVRATDNVGHLGAPASYDITVDSNLLDRIPPETTITSHPPEPLQNGSASFTYISSERNSMFQCRLDQGDFEFCPNSGITYDHLTLGTHTFEVRARDEKANVDPTPASYTFYVALPTPSEPLRPAKVDTRINSRPGRKTQDRSPRLTFSASMPGATFQCKLDNNTFFRRCDSPFTTKRLSYGLHRFKVRAVVGGVADPTPATYSFRVVQSTLRHRRH